MPLIDVIVVGGGPAGSMAAAAASRLGLTTVLLERGAADRDKLCSGVLAPHTQMLLEHWPIDLGPALLGSNEFTELRTHGGPFVVHRHRPILMVSRSQFDRLLRSMAAQQGAEVRHQTTVVELGSTPNEAWVLTSSGERLSSRLLIGADGASGQSAKYVAGGPPPHFVAMEAKIKLDRAGPCILDWRVPGGYAWLFRKRDSMGVGLGYGPPGRSAEVRQRLAAWAAELNVDAQGASGHFIPYAPPHRLVRDRILLAGDAAGAVDPLVGEGIPYALLSGALAAHHAAAQLRGQQATELYPPHLRSLLRKQLWLSRSTSLVRRRGISPQASKASWTVALALHRSVWHHVLERPFDYEGWRIPTDLHN